MIEDRMAGCGLVGMCVGAVRVISIRVINISDFPKVPLRLKRPIPALPMYGFIPNATPTASGAVRRDAPGPEHRFFLFRIAHSSLRPRAGAHT